MNNYDWLISSLDAFIRKYYANKVIRGVLVFLICLLLFVLTVSVSEYYLYLPVWAKLTIVSSFIVSGLCSLVAWVVIPLTKMAKLGKVISHEQAAAIIGEHFGEVNDKLLNILQLKKQGSIGSRELAEASIQQKISQLSVVPLLSAVDLTKNKKYLPYLLPLVLLGIFLVVAAPNVFKESSARLLQPAKAFERPAPFNFIIKNTSLLAVRNSDYQLKLEVTGSILPAQVFIETESADEKLPMQSIENHNFQYTFKNMTMPITFRFYAGGYYSKPYTLKVVQKPVLKSFRIDINYPTYTGKKKETRSSLGDMTLPVGTTISWHLVTEHTDEASIRLGNGASTALSKSANTYAYQYRFLNDTVYTLTLKNHESAVADSYNYHVQVIPDQYPVIQLQQVRDTVTGKQILITGNAGDDYGILKINFNYEVTDKNRTVIKKTTPLAITTGALCAFKQYFDVETLHLQPGQKVAFYIEAWDNDGVMGSKSARSEVMSYQMYDAEQIDSAINENAQQISSGLSNSSQTTKELQTEFKDLQTKMLQSENMDWDQEQSLKEMLKKQNELQTQVENVKQRFEEQVQQSEQKKYSDDVKEKQKELQKQLDNLLNAELKEQMKKLEELMKQLNKDQAVDAMKKMQQDNKLFNMDMQRMKELMSKLEQQMKMEDLAMKADELAKKEQALSEQTEKEQKSAEELSKEQESIKKELEKAMKEQLKDIEELAKQNKQDKGIDEMKAQADSAKEEMSEGQEALKKNDKKKASKNQKKAAEQLQKMAKSMKSAAGGMDMEELEIDTRATRQILSNLIRLSFGQEDLLNDVRKTPTSSQAYVDNMEMQEKLRLNAAMIKDSLYSLSKELDKHAGKIKIPVNLNKMTSDLEHSIQLSVEALESRNVNLALTNQQTSMMRTNDLALLLNEILSNLMQMQMDGDPSSGQGGVGGKKPKPGSGQQLSDIITEQEQLGNAMQQMQGKAGKKPGSSKGDGKGGDKPGDKPGEKPGEKPGGQKPGGQPGGSQPGGQSGGGGGNGQGEGEESENENAETIARLAQQQAAIRRKIQELASQLNTKGMNGAARDLRELSEKMDRTETDLVNRRLTAEMQARQREILTRLLQTEKAVRDQEQDDKRSSKSAEEISRPVPPALQKYLNEQKQLLELYKTVPPQLKPYYKEMVDQYYKIIGNKQ